jgi:uncharacterized OB-fold protein
MSEVDAAKTEPAPAGGRPLPQLDDVSRPYWSALAGGRLRYQECPHCGHRQLYPRACCTACGDTPEWRDASGEGTVHTFTVIRQNHGKPFRDLLPYVVAMVELDEGPRLMTNIVGCPPEDVRIGRRVRLDAERVDDELGLPFFRLAD